MLKDEEEEKPHLEDKDKAVADSMLGELEALMNKPPTEVKYVLSFNYQRMIKFIVIHPIVMIFVGYKY